MDGYQWVVLQECSEKFLWMFRHVFPPWNCCWNPLQSVQTTADVLQQATNISEPPFKQEVSISYSKHGFSVWYSFKAQCCECCEWQDKMAPAPIRCTCLPLACTSLFWPPRSQWYLRWTLYYTWAHPGPAALALVSAPLIVGRLRREHNMIMNEFIRENQFSTVRTLPSQPPQSQHPTHTQTQKPSPNYTLSSHSAESFGTDQKTSE